MDANTQEALNHLITVIKLISPIVGPFIAAIIALIIWAWKKMEKTQDKLEDALKAHILSDDVIHDKLFTGIRDINDTIERIGAMHEINHPGQKL